MNRLTRDGGRSATAGQRITAAAALGIANQDAVLDQAKRDREQKSGNDGELVALTGIEPVSPHPNQSDRVVTS